MSDPVLFEPWDYLIVTASSAAQAQAYQVQLALRRRLGLLAGVRETMAIADPDGRRLGSGGSTFYCLMKVLARELAGDQAALRQPAKWVEALERRRILIIHAGGDSRRLPAYGPCGKIFIPIPGEGDSALPMTLFDRQLQAYLNLPAQAAGLGQVVVAAGDVLLNFDPKDVCFAPQGVTGLGCRSTPQQACRHGVFVAEESGLVRLFLQKPSCDDQRRLGAVDQYGQSILDLGVIHFDACTAGVMLQMCGAQLAPGGEVTLGGAVGRAVLDSGLDLYRELCCAMGRDATAALHAEQVSAGGAKLQAAALEQIFAAMSHLPFHVQILPRCEFLHCSTSPQLISSGTALLRSDLGLAHLESPLSINNEFSGSGALGGKDAWVEGCRIEDLVTLGGENLLVGADIHSPLSLPRGACLDVLPGRDRQGKSTCFIRVYGISDRFKLPADGEGTFCGRPAMQWLSEMGASPTDVWPEGLEAAERTMWNARLFVAAPAEQAADWLWTFQPLSSSSRNKLAWLAEDRYSLADMAVLADQEAFHSRRLAIRAQEIRQSLRRMFRLGSRFSADDLAFVLQGSVDAGAVVADVLGEARFHGQAQGGMSTFIFSRIMHTLASAVEILAGDLSQSLAAVVGELAPRLDAPSREWLDSLGLTPRPETTVVQWAQAVKSTAFAHLGKTIIFSAAAGRDYPASALRSDEIVWGRAPVRLDLGGGWSDTPPYSLEHGGCVINAAVDLNGQPPIQAYARVISEPLIRITSIDQGTRLEIRRMEDLLDYRKATSDFGLAKAALAMAGLSPEHATWPADATLQTMLDRFGGGIELTTLSAVPKGSGLGTSSILGAVIMTVVQKMMGRDLTPQDLFHSVLRLEQALTTGGGWQDQIGAVVGGVKVVTAQAALVPQARVHYVPADILDPHANGGATLLYYTGITRLAKNILQQVVGNYLDRRRSAMATLSRIAALPPLVSSALAGKDLQAFGQLIDVAWRLNKELDPDSSSPQIEILLGRLRKHLLGAKLLGAGGGGFLLMICKSLDDASAVRRMLLAEPPNARGRFFDFSVSHRGLTVTTC